MNNIINKIIGKASERLGGDLDVNGFKITSVCNGCIEITPDGTGKVGLGTDDPKSALHLKGDTPGTIGDSPAGQLIIQNPAQSAWANAVITGYRSDANGDPSQQLWYLGSESSGNSCVILLNRRNSKLHLGTNNSVKVTISGAGNVGIGTENPTSPLQVVGLPIYANNAAAITGGLTAGAFYRTGADPDPVCIVH